MFAIFALASAKKCHKATCGSCMSDDLCSWSTKSSACMLAANIPMTATVGDHLFVASDCPPEPCVSSSDCGACMADDQCSWSNKHSKCILAATMPMTAKMSDYVFDVSTCPPSCDSLTACGGCVANEMCTWALKSSTCMKAEMMPMTAKFSDYLFSLKDCPKSNIALTMPTGSGDFAKMAGKYCSKKMRGQEYDDLDEAKKACEMRAHMRKACKGMYQSGCDGKYKLCSGSLRTSSKGSCAYMM